MLKNSLGGSSMNKEDLIRKLASRKFFALLAGLVTSTLVIYNFDNNQIAQIVGIIGGFGTLIGYIFGQSYVDGKGK
jgi:hypothetical protein